VKPFLKRLLAPVAIAAAVVIAWPLIAEDIDLYSTVRGDNDLPNVLLVLDNSANWSSSIPAPDCYFRENGVTTTMGPKATNPGKEQGTKMAIEKCALYNLIDALPVKSGATGPDADALFNVGLMLLNESPYDGAYPRKAFTPITTNNKKLLKDLIAGLTINGDKGSNADFAKAMYESYLYFKGLAPYQGTAGTKWDMTAVSGGRYVSPATGSCGRNHLIFIANGSPQGSENNDARKLLVAAGGDASIISYPTSYIKNSDQANYADEFARFLRGVDVSGREGEQGIVTHGVAVVGASSDGLYPNFIRSMSTPFGGTYSSASDADVLLQALLSIFNEIQAVNSVFASASLPVSVNARGTFLNQVFIGMFRPDPDAKPRWNGNLKQYQFGLDSLGVLQLVDADGNPAVSSTTGFISTTARSHWTESSTFWNFRPIGTPPSISDAPDGEVVEKGGVAQRLRVTYATGQDARKVLTCVGCAPNTVLGSSMATEFKTGNSLIAASMLMASTAAARDLLIDWLRGTNNAGDEGGPSTVPATTIRPSVHGDVLHSRPAVINFGGTTGVMVFYGANDGMLHAVNGNQTGTGAGEQRWSFIPEEMFPRLNRLRANSPEVRLSTTVSATATPRDYFVDGPIGVYQRFNADLSVAQVIIYPAMRRGGRFFYALDVTNPASPRYLWKKSNSDLPELGQTWSEPKVTRVRGHANPVLVFGGGYDPTAEDTATPGVTTMGHRVYVLDAITGETLKVFATTRSVAADVTLVDSDLDGHIDRAYAVDLGGKVYRVDFETASSQAVADWSMHVVADLSGGTISGRKFFYAPDAVVTPSFTALMVGSGDREKPLMGSNRDHFFQIFDRNTAKGLPAAVVPTVFADLLPASSTSSIAGKGCYVALDQGEKVVNAPITIGGLTNFGTNRPSSAVPTVSNVCSADLGVAKTYAMPLFCVAPDSRVLVGGGLPPSPVAGIVNIGTAGGATVQVPFCIGCINPKNSAIEGARVNPVIESPRTRVFWFQENTR